MIYYILHRRENQPICEQNLHNFFWLKTEEKTPKLFYYRFLVWFKEVHKLAKRQNILVEIINIFFVGLMRSVFFFGLILNGRRTNINWSYQLKIILTFVFLQAIASFAIIAVATAGLFPTQLPSLATVLRPESNMNFGPFELCFSSQRIRGLKTRSIETNLFLMDKPRSSTIASLRWRWKRFPTTILISIANTTPNSRTN